MMRHSRLFGGWQTAAFAAVVSVLFAACDGSSGGGSGGGTGSGGAQLLSQQYGRLVDIYAFRRVDPAIEDRRMSTNRYPILLERDVVIDPEIETQPLVDSVGEVRPGANYRFLPFDVSVGHEELLILWDDQLEDEQFQSAYANATDDARLPDFAPAYRDQNILLDPMPIVPRNAALKLRFDRALGVDTEFFRVNPSSIQVLKFIDDPNVVPASAALQPAVVRILSDGGTDVIVDLSIIGGEAAQAAGGARTNSGLDPSQDQLNANYRIAIPTSGVSSRLLSISPDATPEQNGVDLRGEDAVIRDFRSGNPADGRVGALLDFENPSIVSLATMGITVLDEVERVVTISKRGRLMAIRGRLPFVDGEVGRDSGLPKGPSGVPTIDQNGTRFPLPSGDFVVQGVISPFTGETVRIRAEVLQVLEVGTVEGDANFAGPGLTAAGTDGGELDTVRLRLSNIGAVDSAGNRVLFQAEDNAGAGANCFVQIRYYESLRYANGGFVVSDSDRRAEFIAVDPNVAGPLPNEGVAPESTFAIRFSEPLDLAVVSPLDNFVLSYGECDAAEFPNVLAEPKSATLNFVYSRLIDQNGDATVLKLAPPMGLFHETGQSEQYWLHLDLAVNGLVDFAGNLLDVFDRRPPGTALVNGVQVEVPLLNLSAAFTVEAQADDNFVGCRVFRFAEADEDGSKPGSVDFFGQFQLADGTLWAAPVTRRSVTADGQNLGSIQRWDKGECIAPEDPMSGAPPVSTPPPGPPYRSYGPGVLYRAPSMVTTQPAPPQIFQPPMGPQIFGGIVEPHTSRGARMQMRYLEDDFGLSYHNANELNIDVEQLHWAPWNDGVVLFDRFDRYSMRMAHAKKRPDRLFVWTLMDPEDPTSGSCAYDCLSLYSGLLTRFDDNVLRGEDAYGTVLNDKEYIINPNDAFRAASGIKYVPYPTFDSTYTWRDSRLVSWDSRAGQAIGLGGARDATSDPPDGDRTASVSSPWIKDDPETAVGYGQYGGMQNWVFEQLVRDQADFLGDRTLDHDPIALPLLVDISMWPDDTRAVANAGNLFHIGYLGPMWTPQPWPPFSPNGYYNAGVFYGTGVYTTQVPGGPDPFTCSNIDWPFLRVYSFGGPDPSSTGRVNFVEPDKELIARGGVIKDIGMGDPVFGLYMTKPGDSHIHWSQMDFVRRVSVLTFGFFDTLQPNRHDLGGMTPPLPALPPAAGRPDMSVLNNGEVAVQDMTAILDPAPASQPGGTRVSLEFRAARELTNADLYDPLATDGDLFDQRGNLLNPNYACEAFRYGMPNPGPPGLTPRVPVEGITPYVVEEALDSLRDPLTNLLPRYFNFRVVMENNIQSTPTVTPSLRGIGIVYRVVPTN